MGADWCCRAVCKTIVPDTFSVLLSQRRRWINSTVHNLAELVMVRDLCGTFCFSMQFVVFMELAGTLVLPAAISFTLYLIVISILPATNPKPVIPLILLGIILGLPGLLIVVTSRKVAYLGWMIIYLLSLPIWNLVLPAYAFWHFDDFSWGQTRLVAGEKKELGHGDKDGEFDSSHIVMKRWAEFERDRRFRLNGGVVSAHGSGGLGPPGSRDSYDIVGRGSPKRESNRYSVGSTNETYFSNNNARARDDASIEPSAAGGEYYRPRDNSPLVMLPAPLAVASRPNPGSPMPAPSPVGGFRGGPRDVSPASSASPLTRSVEDEGNAGGRESSTGRPFLGESSARPLLQESGSGDGASWGAGPNPYRWSQQPDSAYDDHGGFFGEGDDVKPGRQPQPQPQQRQASASQSRERQQQGRGVSLVDPGPVGATEGVKRVAKRRQSSQAPPPSAAPAPTAPGAKRYSRPNQPQSPAGSSTGHNSLPPGAAPPNPRTAPSRFQ
jgi:chitin synthase